MRNKDKYTKSQIAKYKRGGCVTKFCRNDHAPGKHYCHKCRARKFKEDNPLRYKYDKVKQNARQRGHEFSISFEYFLQVIEGTGYAENSGRRAQDLQIDRKDVTKGYVEGNLRIITQQENVRKQHDEDYAKPPF